MSTRLAIACLLGSCLFPTVQEDPTFILDRAVEENLTEALQDALDEGAIPGAIGAIVTVGEPTRVGAIGLRKVGAKQPMLATDLVHIGSDTKAMTGVLIARLVEQDKLRWDSTVGEVLMAIADDLHEDFLGVTISQLMHMTAGLPANPPKWNAYKGKPVRTRRLRIAKDAMKKPPLTAPGEEYLYSNLSVMIAGAMAEAGGDADWETLMRKEVFEPLGMKSASFGVPGTKKKVDQPWGHVLGKRGLKPVRHDNDPALGPAGTVHLTMDDWGKFVSIFLMDDARDEAGAFLQSESRKVLVTPDLNSYAMGWKVIGPEAQPWAKGSVLNHSGSNTYWFANAWLAPGRKSAFLIAINSFDAATVPSIANDGVLSLLRTKRPDWR